MITNLQQTNTMPSDAQLSQMDEMVTIIRSKCLEHSARIDMLQKKFDVLMSEALSLRNTIDAFEEHESFLIYQACIQSLNAQYDLKSTVDCSRLEKMPMVGIWNDPIRLFEKGDTKQVRNYKTKKALTMLQRMDVRCKERFSKRYGETFVDDVIRHFNDYDFSQQTTDPVKMEQADEFWRRVR